MIVSIPVSKKGHFLGDRVPSRADIIIMVIAIIQHLVGSPCGSSSHFKMALILPPSWVKMDSSLTFALRGSMLVIALVATTILVVSAVVVEMIGRSLIVVLAAPLISIVAIVGNCWQLMAIVGNWWQLLAIVGNCWQSIVGNCWQVLETNC